MKTVLTMAPRTAPIAGIDLAATCSLTCTENRDATVCKNLSSAVDPCPLKPFDAISLVAFDTDCAKVPRTMK